MEGDVAAAGGRRLTPGHDGIDQRDRARRDGWPVVQAGGVRPGRQRDGERVRLSASLDGPVKRFNFGTDSRGKEWKASPWSEVES